MKIAVISDIHGNLEAFREVLADIDSAGAGPVLCLGDCVGYGADPEQVANLVRSRQVRTVMGNHELAIARPETLSWFNASARRSLRLTDELISEATRDWIRGLPPSMEFEQGLFVHGCPPDSILEYLFEVEDDRLALLMGEMKQKVCFVGHTHLLEAVRLKEGKITRRPLERGTCPLDPHARYVINIGSVGQPRDGDLSAKYVIWDTAENSLDARFVPYDAHTAAEKIIRLGFPRINADRLL